MTGEEKNIRGEYLTHLKAVVRDAHRRTQSLGIITPFERQCLHLHSSATKWLSAELDNHGPTLTEDAFQELLYQAILDASRAIFQDTPLSEERHDLLTEHMLRYMAWENNPTGFEAFLSEKSIFSHGHTDIEKYKTQHDSLQNAYRNQRAPQNVERELEQFDQMFQAYYLHTLFASPLTQAFQTLHTKQQQKMPATTIEAATISNSVDDKPPPLTLKKLGIEGLCKELGQESKKHPQIRGYIAALQQKLQGYQALEIEDYTRLIEEIKDSAPFPQADETVQALSQFTKETFAIANKYFYEVKVEYPCRALSKETYLTRPSIRTLLDTIKTQAQETENEPIRTCLNDLHTALQQKPLISGKQYLTLSRETQLAGLAKIMSVHKTVPADSAKKLITIMTNIDTAARGLFEGLATQHKGRDC